MEAAHDDRHAAPAVLAGDLVGALRGVRLDADRDEIGGLVVRDGLHPIVVEAHLDVGRREAGDRRRRQRLHLPGADVTLSRPAPDARMDERQSHGITNESGCLGHSRRRRPRASADDPVAVVEALQVVRVEAVAEVGAERDPLEAGDDRRRRAIERNE